METKKIDLAKLRGKLTRQEMKNIKGGAEEDPGNCTAGCCCGGVDSGCSSIGHGCACHNDDPGGWVCRTNR